MKQIKPALVVALVACTPFVYAEQGDVKFAFEVGAHGGGDTLKKVEYTDGSTQEIKAGNGLSVAVGLAYYLSDDLIMLTTVGFKEDSTHASNGEVTFSRNTLDILLDKKINDLIWLGGGVTYHSGVEYTESIPSLNHYTTSSFDNALGLIGDVKFDIGDAGGLYLGARFTFIDYTYKSKTYSGNSVGFIFGGAF